MFPLNTKAFLQRGFVFVGDDFYANPNAKIDASAKQNFPDVRLPFYHGPVFSSTFKPNIVPYQPEESVSFLEDAGFQNSIASIFVTEVFGNLQLKQI